MASFDIDHAMHLFWDLDTTPPAIPYNKLFERIKTSIRLYDPNKFVWRLVVYGDFSKHGGVNAFKAAFLGGHPDAPEDRFQFFHYATRTLYCDEECRKADLVRYPDKVPMSHDKLKQDLLAYTTANPPPYHIMIISSDAQLVSPTITTYLQMGFIIHVACKSDADSTMRDVGHVYWDWDLTMLGDKDAATHLRYRATSK